MFAHRVSEMAGSPWTFVTAVALVVIWALLGPKFGFSQHWQLVINTCTTIITFLMVFVIQNTQNREARATQLKLDELIRASKPARDALIDAEELEDDDLSILEEEYRSFRAQKVAELQKRKHKHEHH